MRDSLKKKYQSEDEFQRQQYLCCIMYIGARDCVRVFFPDDEQPRKIQPTARTRKISLSVYLSVKKKKFCSLLENPKDRQRDQFFSYAPSGGFFRGCSSLRRNHTPVCVYMWSVCVRVFLYACMC